MDGQDSIGRSPTRWTRSCRKYGVAIATIIAAFALQAAAVITGAQAAVPSMKPCPVSADRDWTPVERWAWEEICHGRVAALDRMPGTGKEPFLVLRPEFLRTILIDEVYRKQISQLGVRISHGRFRDPLLLDGIPVPGSLHLTDTRFEGRLSLNAARIEGDLILSRSYFGRGFDLSGVRVGNNLYLNTTQSTSIPGAEAADGPAPGALLWGAGIGGNVDLSGGSFSWPVRMDGIRIGSALILSDGDFASPLSVANAQVGGIQIVGGTFRGSLNMQNVRIGSTLRLTASAANEPATFTEINLSRAVIGTDAILEGARVTGALRLNGAEIGGFIRLGDEPQDDSTGSLALCSASLVGARVNGSIILGKVAFRQGCGPVEGIEPAPSHSATSQASRGSAPMAAAVRAGQNCGSVVEPREAGGLPASPASFDPALNLQDANAGALAQLDPQPSGPPADRPARLAAVWPDVVGLQGLTYQRIREGLSEVDAGWLVDWIARDPRFSPQPYEQLAQVLRAEGDLAKANAVLYAARECERRNTGSWFDRGWKWLIRMLIGYGYYVQNSLFAALGLLAVGTGVSLLGRTEGRRTVEQSLLYSFDMLLPFVQLQRGKDETLLLKDWARWYFYAHRIAGFILGSFLIAGLSGLARS